MGRVLLVVLAVVAVALAAAGGAYAQLPDVEISPPDALITNTGPVNYAITYNNADPDSITLEPDNITLNATGTATGRVTVSGTGDTDRTVTIDNCTGDGTLGITIAAGTATKDGGTPVDGAGPSATFIVDNTNPNPIVTVVPGQADPVVADPLAPLGSVQFRVAFDEHVSGFGDDITDIIVMDIFGNPDWSAITLTEADMRKSIFCAIWPSSRGCWAYGVTVEPAQGQDPADPQVFIVTVWPRRDCTVSIAVNVGAVNDDAGNGCNMSGTASIGFNDAPRAQIINTGPPDTNSPTIVFSCEFTEPVDGFGTGDVRIEPVATPGTAGGTKTAVVTGSGEPGSGGSRFNIGVSGMTYSGQVHIWLDAGVANGRSPAWQVNWPSEDGSWCSVDVANYDGITPDSLTVDLPIPGVGGNPATGIVPDPADPTNAYRGVYTTPNIVLDIAGTASDDVGIASVQWSNDRGGSGACSGTTAWSQNGIILRPGQNIITITARDAASNSLTYTLTVNCANDHWADIVDALGDTGLDTSIALDASGNPRISYYYSSIGDTTTGDLRYAEWDGQSWILQTVDGSGTGGEPANVGRYSSLKIDSAGNPHISYYDATNGDLKYAYRMNGVWFIQTVDGIQSAAHDVGQFTSLALDSSSRPRISYYDVQNGDLKYAAWNGTSWARTAVDSVGNVGQYTSLALDSSGRPRIAYYDVTNQDLKYAQGSAATNPTWTTSAVDSGGDVGMWASLVLDSAGLPRIAYYDTTNGDLKYTEGSAAVDPTWTTEAIDVAGNVGRHVSLALDFNDVPRIAYYDVTNGDLRYAMGDTPSLPLWETMVLDDGQGEAGASTYDVGMYASLVLDASGNAHVSYYYNSPVDGLGNPTGDLKYLFRSSGPSCIVTGPSSPTRVSPLYFTITFSAPVTGFTDSDVVVTNGTKGALVQIAPNDGTTYRIAVTPGGNGSVTCRVPFGAARAGTSDNLASNTATVVFDGSRPTVSVDRMYTQPDPTNALPINFTIVFSEPVYGFTGQKVAIGGTAGGTKSVILTGSGSYYNAAVHGVTTAGSVIATVAAGVATDAAGNENMASTSTDNTVWYDGTRPTVTINQASGLYGGPTQDDPTSNTTINFTVVFSEPVIGFTAADVAVTGTASFIDQAGLSTRAVQVTSIGTPDVFGRYATYNVAVSGMQSKGTVIATIPAGAANDCDNVGTPINSSFASTSSDNVVTYDDTRPTVTINQKSDQPDPTKDSPIRFIVKFSKNVTGFTASDVNITGTAGGPMTAVVTGSGRDYTVEVSGMRVPAGQTGPVSVIANIPESVAQDSSGNWNTTATSDDNTVWFDNAKPTAAIIKAADQPNSTFASYIDYTVAFSEPVTGFDLHRDGTGRIDVDDIILTGTAVAPNWRETGSGWSYQITEVSPNDGTTYRVRVTGMTSDAPGTVIAEVGAGVAQDSLGNTNMASAEAADQAVRRAKVVYFPEQCKSETAPYNAIPDNNATGLVSIMDLSSFSGTISDLNVKLSINHTRDSDLRARLIGPNGEMVWLFQNVGGNGVNFTNTVLDDEAQASLPTTGAGAPFTGSYKPLESLSAFDGKSVRGVWQLQVIDNAASFTGSLQSWCLQFTIQPTEGPAVTIDQAPGQVDPTRTSPIRFRVVFNRPVSGFATGDVVLGGTAGATTATVSQTAPNDGTTYNVDVSGMTSAGTVIATVPAGVAVDGLSVPNEASTSGDNVVVFDNIAPSVTINQATGQADPTKATLVNYTVVFSEPVTGFTASDVTLGGTAGASSVSMYETVPWDGTTYNVAVSGFIRPGTVTAAVSAGAAADAAGNTSLASTSTDNSITYAPLTVTINQAVGQADPVNTSPVNFTVEFSEGVTGFAAEHITLTGIAGASVASITPVGVAQRVYTVAVNVPTSGTLTAAIGANKVFVGAYGNLASTSTDNSITFDNVQPTVTINQAAGQADPTRIQPVSFRVVFSEPVTGFTSSDVTVVGPAGATATVTGSGTTYDVAIGGMTASGVLMASIAPGVAQDAAGNGNQASTSTDNTVTFDNDQLTVTIDQDGAQADPAVAGPINFTAVFNKSVSDFTSSDVIVTSSVGEELLATVTGSGTTYNVAVSGMTRSAVISATIPADLATDSVGNTNEASTSTDNEVLFDDGVGPTVTVNQAAGQADPATSEPVNFTVVFDEPVSDFTSADVTLVAPAGAVAVVTGSGTTYNVAVSGMTATGNVSVTVDAGVAHDAAGNANSTSTSTDNDVLFDNEVPTVTIDQAMGQGDPATTLPIDFTVIFSEAVTGFDADDVIITGTAGGTPTVTVSGAGAVYNVAVDGITVSGTVIAAVRAGAAMDAVGNLSLASTSTDNTVTFDDSVAPQVSIEQDAGQADPTRTLPIVFTVQFNKPVTGFTGDDVIIAGTAGGAPVVTVTGSGTNYSVSVDGLTSSGTVVATIPAGVAFDLAGNGNAGSLSTDNSVTYDITVPQVTVNQAPAQSDPASSLPINFVVAFSEPVTGFSADDVVIGGTAGGTPTVTVTGGGADYNIAVGGITTSGTVVASVIADAAQDAAGNLSLASVSTDNTVVFNDGVVPTVTINQASGQSDPTRTLPVNFTVVFSKPVTGFTQGGVIIGGSAGGTKTVTVSGSGATYTVAIGGLTSSGTVVAYIPGGVAFDLAGNGNAASTSTDSSVTYDITGPTVTVNKAASQADPTNATTINFAVVFSEPVSDFAAADVTIGGTAGATTAVVTGSGTTYNVAVSGMTAQGTVVVTVAAGVAHDSAGNPNSASTSTDNSVEFDTASPSVTINQAAGQKDPTNVSPVNFTVVFSKPVADFTGSDVSISGTATGNRIATVTGTGTTYNVAVSGMTSTGTVIATIAAGVAHDDAGNPNTAATFTDNSVIYDVTAPVVEITSPTSTGACTWNCNTIKLKGHAEDTIGVSKVAWTTAKGGSGQCTGTSDWSALGIPVLGAGDTITVTATDGAGNTGTATLVVTVVEALPGANWQSLAMVSLPIIPDDADPKLEVGFYGSSWVMYRPDISNYVKYPDAQTWFNPAASTPGRGFWAGFAGPAAVPSGMVPAQDQAKTIRLQAGWNLIGQPFISPVVWDLNAIQVRRGTEVKRLIDARKAGWVKDYAWGWEPDPGSAAGGAYYVVCDPTVIAGAVGEMVPWRAYWVRASVECDLIVPAP